MVVLIRKIERSKWTKHIDIYSKEGIITPYPITNDMKTCSKNTLSVWEVNTDEPEEFENIILTIASTRDKLQTLDVAVVNKKDIAAYDISIIENDGDTPLEDFKSYHRDLSDLTVEGIMNISQEIMKYVIKNKNNPKTITMRFTKNELIKLFAKKINDKTINIDNLNESFQKDILPKLSQ